MESYTFAEAEELTGATRKALRNRVYRGQLESVLRSGVRRIPRSELERAGLLRGGRRETEETGQVTREVSQETPAIGELIGRLEQLVAENVALRAIEAQTGKTLEVERQARELTEAELHRVRARVLELQAQVEMPRRWRWWRRSVAAAAASPSS